MAVLGARFKAESYDTEQRDYENLPNGVYRLEVTDSEVATTKKGDGTILKLKYGVIEPEEYAKRLIFGNITLENPNTQAQEIGQRQLASLCRAIGLSEIEDSEELHFQGFVAKVGLSKQRTGQDGKVYEPRNEIKRFYFPDADDIPAIGVDHPAAANDNHPPARQAANDNAPPHGDARSTGNGGSAATTGKSRPWGKRAA